MDIKIKNLFIYPLKSAQGIELKTMDITTSGPRHDREWMLVHSKTKNFISQRTHPQMSQISVKIQDDALAVTAPGMPPLSIPLSRSAHPTESVKIFGVETPAEKVGDDFDQWFSEFLKSPVSLVRSPQKKSRQTSGRNGPETEILFADSYPFLLVNQGTLDELNTKLPEPVSIKRFRPNIVIEGAEANKEDLWSQVQVGDIVFLVVKACTRCSIIDIDPSSGQTEPTLTKTLKSYRTKDGQMIFGVNLTHRNQGKIQVGDCLQTSTHSV